MGCGISDLKSVGQPAPVNRQVSLPLKCVRCTKVHIHGWQARLSFLQGSNKHDQIVDGSTPVPLEAIASNLEARLALAPNFSDPSFVQKNYRMPAPPINEAARQDFVEKLHIPRSHQKSDEVTRLLAELLEVSKHLAKQSSCLEAYMYKMSCYCKLCHSIQTTHTHPGSARACPPGAAEYTGDHVYSKHSAGCPKAVQCQLHNSVLVLEVACAEQSASQAHPLCLPFMGFACNQICKMPPLRTVC